MILVQVKAGSCSLSACTGTAGCFQDQDMVQWKNACLMIAMGPSSRMHKRIRMHAHTVSSNVVTINDSIRFLFFFLQQPRKLHEQFGGSSTTLHHQWPSAGKQRQRSSLVKTIVSAFTWVEINCHSIHKGTEGSACAKGWCLDSTGPRNHTF